MAQKVIFAQVLQQLMDERYRRNRSALAEAAHISPSALSQYVRGRATPSLDVLVHLAEILDVSLDHLVFGRERVVPLLELGYLAGHIESHVRNSQAQAASLHDLVARIGTRLTEKVRSTAEELLPTADSAGGALDFNDVEVLERCSAHTIIVTTDLGREVLLLSNESGESAAAPSIFGQVVVENITEGTVYEYILPRGDRWGRSATVLRESIIQVGRLDPSFVDQHLYFRHADSACFPGFVVQKVAMEKLQRTTRDIAERVAPFTWVDDENTEIGFIAYAEPVSTSYEHFNLIASENVPALLRDIRVIRHNEEEGTKG